MSHEYRATVIPLLVGHSAGLYDLPERVQSAVEAEGNIPRLRHDIAQRFATAQAELAALKWSAMKHVHQKFAVPADYGQGWDAAEGAVRRLQALQAEVAEWPVTDAAQHTYEAVAGLRDEIIRDRIRPALEGVMARVKDLAPTVHGWPMTDSRMVSAPGVVRTAFVELLELVRSHAVLREAHDAMLQPLEELHPVEVFKDADRAYGSRWDNRAQSMVTGNAFTPWPLNPVEHLVWLGTKVEAWVPDRGEYHDECGRILARQKQVPYSRGLKELREQFMYQAEQSEALA